MKKIKNKRIDIIQRISDAKSLIGQYETGAIYPLKRAIENGIYFYSYCGYVLDEIPKENQSDWANRMRSTIAICSYFNDEYEIKAGIKTEEAVNDDRKEKMPSGLILPEHLKKR